MISKIVVSGGWSYGNIGDEVIAKCTMGLLDKYFPDVHKIYTSYDPKDFYMHHNLMAIESIHSILEGKSLGTKNIKQILSSQEDYGLDEFCKNLSNETLFIMSGGGYFDGNWDSQFAARILEIELAKKNGSFVAVIGQSIGPFITSFQINQVRNTLGKVDYINVRDEASRVYLKNIIYNKEITCCCDIALTISDFYPLSVKESNQKFCNLIVQVYARYVENGNQRRRNRNIERWIKRITLQLYRYDLSLLYLIKKISSTPNWNIRFVLNVQKTDKISNSHFLNYATKLRHRIRGEKFIEIKEGMNVDEFCAILANSNAIVSCKMHPLIVSASYGIKTIALSQHYKIDAFMEWIGRTACCFRNSSFSARKILDILVNEKFEVDYTIVETRKNDIYQMMEQLRELLDRN